ncbi:hypothetical protein ASPWEDRAFT_111234 [Aspergillus wentii DTO 134E9]|uniref:F-box domain-containing protein n=1 Tax=Aspergillus wentii DTO 134E9 TaxID=1073089 RepID=A0A1L9RLG6_ASPWE|nr:uncharacterized protein ASPWEDRAFT_111234 [Aspergillus wentii DTO 134E9]OJJ35779.1 hypothetical protein ASPWEDRAFT_111234 [Aspergillus wentii DTO 134E9]
MTPLEQVRLTQPHDIFILTSPVYVHQGEVYLTGVGSKQENFKLRAPNDENARWDTMGDDYVLLVGCWENAYYFHEICWDRFMAHFNTDEFDRRRLYEALQYLPLLQGPWRIHFPFDPYDPFRLPTIEQLMQFPKEMPRSSLRQRIPHDCFGKFPLEICEAIAESLPIRDALGLRYVSRTMIPLFGSRAFWKSRFGINSERGFLYSVLARLDRETKQKMDWRLLYHCTSRLKCSRGFEYNITTWESIRWLRDAVLAQCPIRDILHFQGRALQHYHHTGHRDTHTEPVDIQYPLKNITISTYMDDGEFYITGMEFISNNESTARIGYTTPGAVAMTDKEYKPQDWPTKQGYRYPGLKVIFSAKRFRGFRVETEPPRIRYTGPQ